MMVPVGMSMLYRAYPPEDRVNVARLITRVMVIAPATAPIIGGSLVTWASWRWIFTINIPVGAVGVHLRVFVPGRAPGAEGGKVRSARSGLRRAGLGLLLFRSGSGPTLGWGSAESIGSGVVASSCSCVFVRLELAAPTHSSTSISGQPAVSPVLRGHRLQVTDVLRNTGVHHALPPGGTGSLRDRIPGLSTFPEAIAIGISSQIVARLFPRIGPRRLMAGGFVGIGAVTSLLASAGLSTSLWEVRGLCFFLGVSVSFIMLPTRPPRSRRSRRLRPGTRQRSSTRCSERWGRWGSRAERRVGPRGRQCRRPPPTHCRLSLGVRNECGDRIAGCGGGAAHPGQRRGPGHGTARRGARDEAERSDRSRLGALREAEPVQGEMVSVVQSWSTETNGAATGGPSATHTDGRPVVGTLTRAADRVP